VRERRIGCEVLGILRVAGGVAGDRVAGDDALGPAGRFRLIRRRRQEQEAPAAGRRHGVIHDRAERRRGLCRVFEPSIHTARAAYDAAFAEPDSTTSPLPSPA
jgi:hypothetical protein